MPRPPRTAAPRPSAEDIAERERGRALEALRMLDLPRRRLYEGWAEDFAGRVGVAEATWRFLTAKDVDDKPIIWTPDENDDKEPVKPFPAQKGYLRDMLVELWRPERIILVDKIRQRYVSTICCLAAATYCAFFEEREFVISKLKEASAAKLLNDKIRVPWKRLPTWLRQVLPISPRPRNVVTFYTSRSTASATSQNAANSERGITASLFLIDEAAFQDQYPEIMRAVMPMATRIWAISTANIGNEGARRFKEQIFEGRPKLEW